MRERGITEDQIRTALRARPDVISSTDSLCYRHTFDDGRTLKVWVKPGMTEPRIIKSAAWEGE